MLHKFEDNQLNVIDTSNIENIFGIWFWNKSANESDLNTKENRYSDDNDRDKNKEERNQEEEESKTQ